MIEEDKRMRKRQFSSRNDGKRNGCNQHPYGCICGYYNNTPKNQIIVGYPPQQPPKQTKQPVQNVREKAKKAIGYLKTRFRMARCAFYIRDAYGKRRKCYMVATIPMWSMKEEKTYVVYSDGRRDTSGNLNLYVTVLDVNAPRNQQMLPITDAAEKEKLDWIVSELKDEMENGLMDLSFHKTTDLSYSLELSPLPGVDYIERKT